MMDQFEQERVLQSRYPAGSMGKFSPKDTQTLTHLLSRGWEPQFTVTVRYSYVSAQGVDCLFLRWGLGKSDWAGVSADGFEAITND